MRFLLGIVLGATAIAAVPLDTPPANSLRDQCARCCTLLHLSHPNDTLLPSSNGYEASLTSYWSLQARTNPSCIATPSSSRQVSLITDVLVKNSCPFAIRSGGHNPFPNNNIEAPGITIDLGRLNAVSLKNGKTGSTASIGPGARWGEVYDYLTPKGVMVTGGRAATVGVGGLVLGGGNSFFAARFGFVCDNVENFEVVLASGKIVDANSKTNSDLWQALKGGSNNFGIVTRIDLTAFESGDIWGGVVLYPASTIPDQISAFVKFNNAIEQDPYASLITFWAYISATNTTVVQNCYEYTRPVANAPIFTELLAIKPEIPNTNTLRIANLTSLAVELEAKGDLRDLFATLTFANDPEIISQVYNISQKLLQPIKNAKGLNWITMFQPIPYVITEQSIKRGGNVMGLDRKKGNQVLFLFFVQWSDTADDKAIYAAADGLMEQVTELTRRAGKDNEWIYLNYALQNQDVLGGYGRENVEKIKSVAQKYDPDGVFQKLVPGGYKIADAKPRSR